MGDDFTAFPKIARWSREVVVTEKIDGTNAQILIDGDVVRAGSRKRWITPDDDNFGFARWVEENRDPLIQSLGDGRHYGEWWGQGIQRRYGLDCKRFSLFNVDRYLPEMSVPVLYRGPNDEGAILACLEDLAANGSRAAPGFMNPEGIVIWHTAGQVAFKKTLLKDEEWKGRRNGG